MKTYQKFSFEPIIDGKRPQSPNLRKKTLGDADIEAARSEGFAEGEASALAIAEQKSAESLRSIAHMMQMLLGRLASESDQLRQEAVDLSLAAAKAIAGAAINQNNETQIGEYLKVALDNLASMPRIVVKIPTESAPEIKAKLVATAQEIGFEGKLEVKNDDNARLGDCSIEWQSGAIRHDQEQTIIEIEKMATEWLVQAQTLSPNLDLFEP